jgi:2-polyprenyl-3-methyl-5-hydroxy-6-metoxy-1,4-benzoquinol methylase
MLHQLNTQKTEQFGEKLMSILNHGSLAFMISIGHRTGLFDTMSKMELSSSKEIAEAAGLNERYVREWLGAMVTGGLVEVMRNGQGPKYYLPREHAASLTRDAGADNVAPFTQYMAVLGSVEDQVVDCFKNGGGVPYSAYKRFHPVMAEDSGQSIVSSLFDHVLPLSDGILEQLEKGIKVLDIGCGMGKALILMAETYPYSHFTGLDLSEEAISKAKATAKEKGLTNITFKVQDLTEFDMEAPVGQYDFITAFDAIHDQARPDRVLAGIYKALKRNGSFLMQDIAASSEVEKNIDNPIAPFMYSISTMHCMTVSLAQGGMGLGTMWGKEKALEMLSETGFDEVDVKNLAHDFQNNYYIANKKE